MKPKYIYLLLIVASLSKNVLSQWEPDVRLTNDPFSNQISHNNARCIAASGDTVHIVWSDNSDGNSVEIYYQRSINGGSDWEPDTMLSSFGNMSWFPSITTEGSSVFITWADSRDGNPEIYFKGSLDGGSTWGFDKRLTNSSSTSGSPSIASSGSDVHVVFVELDAGRDIFYRRSTDNGNFWVTYTQLTNDPSISESPSVAVYGQTVHVAWWDQRDGNAEIYYKRSSDGGVNWGLDTRLTLNSAISSSASIAVSGLVVQVVWVENRDGNFEIYHKRSIDGGLSWDADARLTNDIAVSSNPSLAVSGQTVHVIWLDQRDGNTELYHKRSIDNGLNWSTDERLTNNPEGIERPSVTVSDSAVHVLWMDYRDEMTAELYYKRNLTGNPTDVTIADNNIPDDFILYQNYPNPFNPTTTIKFSIPLRSSVTIKIFDLLGVEIKTLIKDELDQGTYNVEFNANNLTSGVYFYVLIAGNFRATKKMLLLK